MAKTKIIKRRIKAAKSISQITRAMQMVSAAKMKRAQDAALANRNYATSLFEMTGKLLKFQSQKKENIDQILCLVISPNKGLCGSLVTNLLKKVLQLVNEYKDNVKFITIGKKCQQAVGKFGNQLLASFDIGSVQPRYEKIVPIADLTEREFATGKYQQVIVLYTDFVNTLVQKAAVKKILPIEWESLKSNEKKEELNNKIEYLFEPGKKEILEELVPYYIENQIYQLVLESYASEQSARMVSMKNATENAMQIAKDLTLIYNRERQTQITNEIADIATAQLVI